MPRRAAQSKEISSDKLRDVPCSGISVHGLELKLDDLLTITDDSKTPQIRTGQVTYDSSLLRTC